MRIIGQFGLHNLLQKILSSNLTIHEFADTRSPSDNIDGFESEDDIFDENESHEEHIVTANLITHQEPNNLPTTTISTETAISSSSPPVADAVQLMQLTNNNLPAFYHVPLNYYAPTPLQQSNYLMPYHALTTYNAPPQYNVAPSHYNTLTTYHTQAQYNAAPTQYNLAPFKEFLKQ